MKRHLSLEELKGIESVQRLKDNYAYNANVKVSPARSANSDTSIQVKSSYKMMSERVREDLREEIRHQIIKEVERRVESEVVGKFGLLIDISRDAKHGGLRIKQNGRIAPWHES